MLKQKWLLILYLKYAILAEVMNFRCFSLPPNFLFKNNNVD